MVNGHLEVTYHLRVRYTASNQAETPRSSFDGMVSNVMRVSALSNSVSDSSVASVRPDGAGSLIVSAIGQFITYPGLPGFPGADFPGLGVASDARTSINSGHSVTQNVPSAVVPVGSVGTVYYQIVKIRKSFNYKHYLNAGRHILGFNLDGTEDLHKGQVDRPTGGVGFVVWVQDAASDWPESTTLDLGNM